MDVMKMAKANVQVLKELKECTDKLEAFNEYLDNVEGYTKAIHRFESQFGEQADRLHILEEIRDFFRRHKSEIAKTTADADKTLQESLEQIKESTSENVNEMQKRFVEQSEHFKKILEDEKDSFERFMTQMNAQFSVQMSHMPQLAKQLEEISSIPVRLDKLIDKVEKSNTKLASDISFALNQSIQTSQMMALPTGNGDTFITGSSMPSWMKWTAVSALIIIASACIFNVVVYFFPKQTPVQPQPPYVETVLDTPISTPAVIDIETPASDKQTKADTVK